MVNTKERKDTQYCPRCKMNHAAVMLFITQLPCWEHDMEEIVRYHNATTSKRK